MNFTVEISETLVRSVCLEAATQDEAIERIKCLYRKEEIVLDSNDFVNVEFNVKS